MESSLLKALKFVMGFLGILILWNGCANFPNRPTSNPDISEMNSSGSTQLETESKENTDQRSEVAYRFTDIPVPAKFKLLREKSFIYQAGTIKAGIVTYTGWSKLETLIDFYKKEMPSFDWEIVNIFEHENVTLLYAKEGWNCTVRIYSKNLGGSKIEILIGPINSP